MKIAILNKSDLRGGAAVVSSRLAEALRGRGHDVRMIVCEKLGDDPSTKMAASRRIAAIPFLFERLKLFARTGFDRPRLFQLDPATEGLPLHRHPDIKSADAILINWTNQGMLSLRGLRRLLRLGKPVVMTMHDMWDFTGICHHSGICNRYEEECGCCPLLKKGIRGKKDLSHLVLKRKKRIYAEGMDNLSFVAVSNWLARRAASSSLLAPFDRLGRLTVIPNPFKPYPVFRDKNREESGELRIVFGAARIDDPVKDPGLLAETMRRLADNYPEIAAHAHLVTFGNLKNPDALAGIPIRHTHLGAIPSLKVAELYSEADISLSTSRYETLPGTLVEGQAYGAIPVATDHGGQSDIVEHKVTGWLAPWSDDTSHRADTLAEGIAWVDGLSAAERLQIRENMRRSVERRFSPDAIASAYESKLKSQHTFS